MRCSCGHSRKETAQLAAEFLSERVGVFGEKRRGENGEEEEEERAAEGRGRGTSIHFGLGIINDGPPPASARTNETAKPSQAFIEPRGLVFSPLQITSRYSYLFGWEKCAGFFFLLPPHFPFSFFPDMALFVFHSSSPHLAFFLFSPH